MKVLITGATGLIGQELVATFLDKGHTVNYLTTSQQKIIHKPNCFRYYWNPNTNTIDDNCLINVDVIIHLAGASIAKRWTKEYKQEIIESRINSADLLYKTLKTNPHQVQQIISASGTAMYPEGEIESYDESTKSTDENFLASVVKQWEESVDVFQKLGIKVSKIRTGVVFANNGGALPEMVKPIKMGFGASMGNGKQIQSWIHHKDLVNLYYFIFEKQLEGVFNAVAPNPISNEQLTKTIAKILQKPLILPNIPQFVMKLILGEMSFLLFSSKNVSSEKIQKLGFQFQFPTAEEAIKDLYQ